MGMRCDQKQMNAFLLALSKENEVWAPKRFSGGGTYSDTDCIRYGKIQTIDDIVWNEKSAFSFKEILTPISQVLFYFTEDEVKEPDLPKKGAIIFLRSCDMHAVRRLDAMYLHNGPEDIYYRRLRDKLHFIVMGCRHSFDNCFCVSMGTNKYEDYEACINEREGMFELDVINEEWKKILMDCQAMPREVKPDFVYENKVKVHIPENLSAKVALSSMWDEYTSRCINCGRCNFVCPTCTCFTMQDLYYSENKNVGERRRIWASCMVDGFTDVAGGGSYRKKNGERMRFKVLHKVLDFKQRNGFQMCVGCGRCDDICPEYISFSHCINKLEDAMKEVSGDE